MESKNPVFRNSESFSRGGYATVNTPSPADLESMYTAPSATTTQMGRMTIDDVVMRTATLFGVMLLTGAGAWVLGLGMMPALIAAIAAMVVGFVISAKRQASPALCLTYAALEGVFVGALSHWYATAYGANIIGQAVLGTLAAFTGMLVLYRSGRLRATPKFTKVLLTAGLGYLVLSLVSVLSAAFGGVGNGWGFFGLGALGLLLCVAGVALASFFLILDFDYIEQAVRNGAPERESWRAGFGLLVTLVWLYLEILRLLAILRGDN